MSRSRSVHAFLAAGALAVTLVACKRGSEAPAPQPQTEVAPVVAEQTPAAQPPVSNPPAVETAKPAAPQPAAPAPEPASTPGTSLPGAIPPAPPVDPNAKPPAEQPVDPLKWLQDREARRADYQRKLKETEADLAVATASVADWEKTVLAFENPFRPRPKLAADDAAAIESMDGAQRTRWAKGKLETARAAREAAQKTLDDLKANPPPD